MCLGAGRPDGMEAVRCVPRLPEATQIVRAMVGALGNIGEAINRAEPTMLGSLYEALRMEAMYDAEAGVVTVTIRPAHVAETCPRGDLNTDADRIGGYCSVRRNGV